MKKPYGGNWKVVEVGHSRWITTEDGNIDAKLMTPSATRENRREELVEIKRATYMAAAAPELYEALEGLVMALLMDVGSVEERVEAGRAALAKADEWQR